MGKQRKNRGCSVSAGIALLFSFSLLHEYW
jgi:hypothetical protein